MNHKNSTYVLFGAIFILMIGFTYGIDSSDMDEICNINNHVLIRVNGSWMCASINDTLITQINNNITNIFNNFSLLANSSDFWDNWDTFSEALNANRTGGDVTFGGNVKVNNNLTVEYNSILRGYFDSKVVSNPTPSPTLIDHTQDGSFGTITTTSAHNLIAGDIVRFVGWTWGIYFSNNNKALTVIDTPTPTTFRIAFTFFTVANPTVVGTTELVEVNKFGAPTTVPLSPHAERTVGYYSNKNVANLFTSTSADDTVARFQMATGQLGDLLSFVQSTGIGFMRISKDGWIYIPNNAKITLENLYNQAYLQLSATTTFLSGYKGLTLLTTVGNKGNITLNADDKIILKDNTIIEGDLDVTGNTTFASEIWKITKTYMGTLNPARPAFLNEVPSETNPNIVPTRTDDNTGIGRSGADSLELIAGGMRGVQIDEIGNEMFISIFGDTEFQQKNISNVTNFIALGNITSENVFIPQDIFVHTNATQVLLNPNEWKNLTFDQEVTDIRFGIEHNSLDNTNHTFTFTNSGIYYGHFDIDVEDTSIADSIIDVGARLIFINGTEIAGTLFETDIVKKDSEVELSHHFLIKVNAGDKVILQFIADNANVISSTHGTFGDHPESSSLVLKKVRNLN